MALHGFTSGIVVDLSWLLSESLAMANVCNMYTSAFRAKAPFVVCDEWVHRSSTG